MPQFILIHNTGDGPCVINGEDKEEKWALKRAEKFMAEHGQVSDSIAVCKLMLLVSGSTSIKEIL